MQDLTHFDETGASRMVDTTAKSETERQARASGLVRMQPATLARIRERMGLHGVVVHAVRYAGAAVGGLSAGIEGPYCPAPKLSTGAGDHFNGGFCAGIMADLPVAQALYSGVGASGWYVRNAKSPRLDDVVGLLKQWGEGSLKD